MSSGEYKYGCQHQVRTGRVGSYSYAARRHSFVEREITIPTPKPNFQKLITNGIGKDSDLLNLTCHPVASLQVLGRIETHAHAGRGSGEIISPGRNS